MRVLVADDDPVHTRLVKGLLVRWGNAVVTAGDGEEAMRLLEEARPIQLVIADWMMPRMDGLQLCREIRTRFNEPYVYTILLTSRDRHDDILEGFGAGVDDYLTKPVHHGDLDARVRVANRIMDLQQRLLEAQEHLRIQATHDPLTGVWNRRAIFGVLEQEINRAGRGGSSLAVIMIDFDHFKAVNDTFGHLVGDAVLREAALRLRKTVRSYDSVGRYGGEEFLIVAPGLDGEGAFELAERLRVMFERTPIDVPGNSIGVALSLGVVSATPGSGARPDELLDAADLALYKAKAEGRNTSVLGKLRSERTTRP